MTAAHAMLLALLAAGQPEKTSVELRPVEAGIEDVSPIGASQRNHRTDLREPTGFDRVYEMTNADGGRSYVRVNGAVYAIFDQAWYTQQGAPAVPAGTRFHIGSLPAPGQHQSGVRQPEPQTTAQHGGASNAVSLRAAPAAADREAGQPAPRPETSAKSMVANEFYRRARISELLGRALAARSESTR